VFPAIQGRVRHPRHRDRLLHRRFHQPRLRARARPLL